MNITKIICCAGLLVTFNAAAEVAVIVNLSNKATISEKQVKDLYMLKGKYFPDGKEAQVYNLAGEADVKKEFYKKVLLKDEGRLNAVWVRALFSSKAIPPKDFGSAAMMKAAVANNPNAIGFINSKDVDDSVRVVITK